MTSEEAANALKLLPPDKTVSSGMTSEEAGRALSLLPAEEQDRPSMSIGQSLRRNIPAILGSAGRDLINTPRNLLNLVPGITQQNNPIHAYEPNFDYYQAMGVDKGLPQELAQGALGFAAPLGIAKGLGMIGKLPMISAGLQENALAGAGYGAINDPDSPYKGLAEGAGLGALGHGAGAALGALGSGAADLYAKSAIPGMVSRGTKLIRKGLGNVDESVMPLKSAHDDAVKNANALWDATDTHAQTLDNNLVRPNTNPYTDYINNYVKNTSGLERSIGAPHDEAMDFAKKEAKDLTPQSYQGVVKLRQGLNEEVGKFLKKRNADAPSRELNNFIGGLKSSLNDVVDASNPEASESIKNFANTWENANKATQNVKQFYKSPDKYGTLQFNQNLKNGLTSPNPDPAILKEFLPKPGQVGTHGINHLTNLVGDEDTAINSLKSYSLKDLALNSKNPKNALDYYSKMSPNQRDLIFGNGAAEPLLNMANKATLRYADNAEEPWIKNPVVRGLTKFTGYHLLPGAIAGGAAYGSGASPETALGVGLGLGSASFLGSKLMNKVSPQSVQRAMDFADKQRRPGTVLNPALNILANRN